MNLRDQARHRYAIELGGKEKITSTPPKPSATCSEPVYSRG